MNLFTWIANRLRRAEDLNPSQDKLIDVDTPDWTFTDPIEKIDLTCHEIAEAHALGFREGMHYASRRQ